MQYFLHRHGEWLMLMIGEGILSLLLVTEHLQSTHREERTLFYLTFAPTFLTELMVQFTGFAFEEWNTEDHVMHASLGGGAIWIILRIMYYCATLALGVGLRVHLKNYYLEPDLSYAWLLFGSQALQYVCFMLTLSLHARRHIDPRYGLTARTVGGIRNYFTKFPTSMHRRYLPILWCAKLVIVVATLCMPLFRFHCTYYPTPDPNASSYPINPDS